MADSRQERVNRLKEAYEAYFAHLRSHGTPTGNPGSFGFVATDDKARSEIALKMALQEIVRPI